MTVVWLSVIDASAGPVAAGVTARVNARVAEPWVARMSADVLAPTAAVEIVKLAVSLPAATVTLAGTVATAVLSLESETTTPPAVAGAVNVTVPVAGEPPVTETGRTLRLLSVGVLSFTVSVAVLDTPPAVAVMTEPLVLAVLRAVTVNVALVAPAATVTLAGTDAAVALPLLSDTVTPPAGAGPVRVTVPVLVEPSTTADGLRVRLDSVGAALAPLVTPRTAERATPPPVAVIVAELFAATALVATVNVAVRAPPATVTVEGTDATELLLDRATVWPPDAAAALSVTVPVDDDPPVTDVGLRPRAETVGAAGVDVTVQPLSRAFAGVAEPSLTSIVQSAGRV
jgi:hypothetical protein